MLETIDHLDASMMDDLSIVVGHEMA